MRNRPLIALLSMVGMLAIWWLVSRMLSESSRGTAMTSTPAPKTNSSPAKASIAPATAFPKLPPAAKYETLVERFTSDFRTPINFFGKVIDQHGEPVTDADVKLSVNDKAGGGKPSEYIRKTNAAGMFSITGIGGITLAAEVSKPGYRVIPPSYGKVTSSGLFEYGLSSRGAYKSSNDAPTIFTLYKQGKLEPLAKIGEKNFRMARDGAPLSITLDGQGSHPVILRCWNQELQRPAEQRQYDWRLEVSVPNGGLLERKDAFAFESPQDGYAPSDTVNMPTSLGSQWRSFAERSYFIRFDDGTFARVNLRMRAGGDHFVVWESFFNPKVGSPNLEANEENPSAGR